MKNKVGVLLINLGTPDSPQVPDVRRYLNEFLTDGRVVDVPWPARQALVRGAITPFRSKESAKSYKEIWDPVKGSPLKYISEELTDKVQAALREYSANNGQTEYHVELAMRYQSPSIERALTLLRRKRVNRYIVLPLFPQYASASTGSAHQKVMEIVGSWQSIPPINFIHGYHDDPHFINAFAEIGKQYPYQDYDHVLFSFHGVPLRHLRKADDCNHCLKTPDCCHHFSDKNQFCYGAQCVGTAKALAKKLNIPEEYYSITYQSRLGKDPWMEPYTVETLERLAQQGKKRVLVFCPAFVADCLETIFEIAVEYQEDFEKFGGEKVQLVESLNSHPLWVETLKQMVLRH